MHKTTNDGAHAMVGSLLPLCQANFAVFGTLGHRLGFPTPRGGRAVRAGAHGEPLGEKPEWYAEREREEAGEAGSAEAEMAGSPT
ncbi:MAG: hypothetical protein WBE26_12810, partial [Phycisphaerae bacterium]